MTSALTLRSTSSGVSTHTIKSLPLTNTEIDTNFINIDGRITSEVALLAPRSNPTFTGTATFSGTSVPDQTAGNSSAAAANTKFVTTAVANIPK